MRCFLKHHGLFGDHLRSFGGHSACSRGSLVWCAHRHIWCAHRHIRCAHRNIWCAHHKWATPLIRRWLRGGRKQLRRSKKRPPGTAAKTAPREHHKRAAREARRSLPGHGLPLNLSEVLDLLPAIEGSPIAAIRRALLGASVSNPKPSFQEN